MTQALATKQLVPFDLTLAAKETELSFLSYNLLLFFYTSLEVFLDFYQL